MARLLQFLPRIIPQHTWHQQLGEYRRTGLATSSTSADLIPAGRNCEAFDGGDHPLNTRKSLLS